MKKVVVDGVPHLCLFAVNNIDIGDQLLFDYGDDAGRLFWRNKVRMVSNLSVIIMWCLFIRGTVISVVLSVV